METFLLKDYDSLEEYFEESLTINPIGFDNIMEILSTKGWDRWKFFIEVLNLLDKPEDNFNEWQTEQLFDFLDFIQGNGINNDVRLHNEPYFPEWWDYMEKALWRKDLYD